MSSPTQPGPDEVLVHVRASGLNFADCSMREGLYDRLPKTPAVVGMEGSGDIVSVGHAVDKFKVRIVYYIQCTMNWPAGILYISLYYTQWLKKGSRCKLSQNLNENLSYLINFGPYLKYVLLGI